MRERRSMRFQTRIFLTVICVALVPIILCFALLLPMMVSTSAKRQEETARAQLAGMTRQLTETFSGMERALDALAEDEWVRSALEEGDAAHPRAVYAALVGQAAKVPEMTQLMIVGADGVCLCANVQDLGGALPLLPETVHTLKNGLRIGITGIVTDYVNVWEQPQNLKKLRITEAFDAARAACARLRPICDICVCIYHGGFEEDLHTGAVLSGSGENLACRIARELDFDLLLTGHQHMPVESVRIGGTFAVQPPANAGRYLQVEAAVRDGGAEFSARLLPVGGIHREQPYRRLLPLEQAAQRWLDEPVGHLEQAIPPEEKLRAALHGSAVAALFNQVQLSHTGADISCTSLGNEPAGLAASVTMRAITAAYLFSNTLVVLEITEEILRALLERCASYFTLENGTPRVSDAFLAPKVEHYNYDFFAGISYQFDLRQPVGRRLTRLSRLDGTPLGPGPLRLCTSNYRATGTGGYDALRTCPVLWRGSVEMPELVAEYVRANSPVSLPCNGRMEAIW